MQVFPVRDGLCPCCGTVPPIWTPAAIVEAARAFQDQYGRPPGKSDWERATGDNPASDTVYRIFGGFPEMRRVAGLTPGVKNGRHVFWTTERICEAMLDFVAREGRWPRVVDWVKASPLNPCTATVVNVFGSFTKAKLAAGWARGMTSSPTTCSGCGGSFDTQTVGCRVCWGRHYARLRRGLVAA